MKLIEIAKGWFNFIQASPMFQKMIAYRLEICDACSEKKQLNGFGQKLMKAINEEGSIFICGKCNCPLAGKTANPKTACPLTKWQAYNTES